MNTWKLTDEEIHACWAKMPNRMYPATAKQRDAERKAIALASVRKLKEWEGEECEEHRITLAGISVTLTRADCKKCQLALYEVLNLLHSTQGSEERTIEGNLPLECDSCKLWEEEQKREGSSGTLSPNQEGEVRMRDVDGKVTPLCNDCWEQYKLSVIWYQKNPRRLGGN